jgi:hypothetical protein
MLKLFKESGARGVKENDGDGDPTMIYFKNFYKYHNVSPGASIIKNKQINKRNAIFINIFTL